MVVDVLKQYDRFVIYGAQVVAYGAYVAIKALTGRKPECFAVGTLEGNPGEIDGIPVRQIDSVPADMLVIVGVTELVQKEVLPALERSGYNNVFALTQHEEHLLMSAYYSSIKSFPLLDVNKINKPAEMVLYEVMNDRDKPLSFHPALFPYERSIQAGAALTEKKIADITDDRGENISLKNRQYCEMSAVYWIWKNTDHPWTGIEHYRRHILIKPEMLNEDTDAVLPLPYICYPNEMTQFRRFVSDDVVDAFITALKDIHFDKWDEYEKILFGKYQYTYNMICARREIFNDYCSWFFKITEHIEDMGKKYPEIRNTRALSYVAEVLTNLYFMSNSGNFKIAHVEKAIYT